MEEKYISDIICDHIGLDIKYIHRADYRDFNDSGTAIANFLYGKRK
jgi:hypothetical protein